MNLLSTIKVFKIDEPQYVFQACLPFKDFIICCLTNLPSSLCAFDLQSKPSWHSKKAP